MFRNVSAPYEQGYRAYLDGQPDTSCPFKGGDARGQWFAGWLDARTKAKFGGLFERWGVK